MKPKKFWSLKAKANRKAKVDSGRMEKYGNVRVDHSGYSFDSKLEAAVFDILKWREKAGEIKDITVQDSVYLTDARIQYIADFKFTFVQSGEPGWAEAKGYASEKWPIKRRLWISYGPGVLEIYKGDYRRPTLTETLTPRPRPRCLYCGGEK